MPKIEVPELLFEKLLNKKYTHSELEDIFPIAKAELDDYDAETKTLKVELNDTNRPDLWSVAGVARALNVYESGKPYKYDFFSTKGERKDDGGRKMVNHKEAIGIRDYSIGFACKGVTVDEEMLHTLIQSQEKLCHNFGRKRKTIAMGIYRSSLLTYPVHYSAVDPDKTHFIPLGMEEDLTLREICVKHPKGKEYGHIVSDKPLFPYLYDDNGRTLSFPPVINSADIGAVEAGDSDLFLEFSGPIIDDLLLAAAIMACDLSDLGFEILPVSVTLAKETKHGKEITVPYFFQEDVSGSVSFIEKRLGLELPKETILKALSKMGINGNVTGDTVTITPPEYRNDFLHAVDISEDVMVGYGLENIEPVMPSDFTVGYLSETEEFSRKVKTIMVGLGFQEMMYNYLGSKKEYIDNMHISGEDCVFIANPMSENYEVVRPSVIPSLLESESMSGHAAYPHKIFEIGKVVYKDDRDVSGTVTKDKIGFLVADNQVGYNEAASLIQTLLYFVNKEYVLTEVKEDPRFIPGRSANITVNGVVVGIFGEVHPQVLESWGCSMPAISCEIDLNLLMN